MISNQVTNVSVQIAVLFLMVLYRLLDNTNKIMMRKVVPSYLPNLLLTI